MARNTAALARGLRRHPWVMLNAVLLVAFGAAGFWRSLDLVSVRSPQPADLFMESIVAEDGDLGWRQLCPRLQSQLPRDVLEEHTSTQRSLENQRGLTLSIEHVGDRLRPSGGEVRIYVATAHAADGSSGQKTYVITTQASGCVESVQS